MGRCGSEGGEEGDAEGGYEAQGDGAHCGYVMRVPLICGVLNGKREWRTSVDVEERELRRRKFSRPEIDVTGNFPRARLSSEDDPKAATRRCRGPNTLVAISKCTSRLQARLIYNYSRIRDVTYAYTFDPRTPILRRRHPSASSYNQAEDARLDIVFYRTAAPIYTKTFAASAVVAETSAHRAMCRDICRENVNNNSNDTP